MDISNFLNVSTNFIDFAVEKISSGGLNWIGKVIQAIIEGVSITGLGIDRKSTRLNSSHS